MIERWRYVRNLKILHRHQGNELNPLKLAHRYVCVHGCLILVVLDRTFFLVPLTRRTVEKKLFARGRSKFGLISNRGPPAARPSAVRPVSSPPGSCPHPSQPRPRANRLFCLVCVPGHFISKLSPDASRGSDSRPCSESRSSEHTLASSFARTGPCCLLDSCDPRPHPAASRMPSRAARFRVQRRGSQRRLCRSPRRGRGPAAASVRGFAPPPACPARRLSLFLTPSQPRVWSGPGNARAASESAAATARPGPGHSGWHKSRSWRSRDPFTGVGVGEPPLRHPGLTALPWRPRAAQSQAPRPPLRLALRRRSISATPGPTGAARPQPGRDAGHGGDFKFGSYT